MSFLDGFKYIISIVGGFICLIFGGFDFLFLALCYLIILDYISGLIKSVYRKELDSKIGFKGILKKFQMLIVVVGSVVLSQLLKELNMEVPIREITIITYISNEGLSILENSLEIIPVPEKLKEIFIQLKEGR